MTAEQIRAVIRPAILPSDVSELRSRFAGPNAGLYVDLAIEARSKNPKVIATSLTDAYEKVLEKKCKYVGPGAEAYIRLELSLRGFNVDIVTPDEFAKILENQGQLDNPS